MDRRGSSSGEASQASIQMRHVEAALTDRGATAGKQRPHQVTSLPALESLETRADGKVILTEEYSKGRLGFDFPSAKKWMILCVIFIVQVSMNLNAAIYGNAVPGMMETFGIDSKTAKIGQAVFLIAYGFGSELWAPWSEELGRYPIMQASLFLVNLTQIVCALAPNYNVVIVGRLLGGLSSAGGSVTLGMIADMWGVDNQQFALNFMVLSSCGGSALGPIFGAFIQRYADWRWVFWVSLIVGVVVQAIHLFVVPETRINSLITKEAKRLRKEDPATCGHVYGPDEVKVKRPWKEATIEVLKIWGRPFYMFATEPIVSSLSLLSGFSDALIFVFIDSFQPVFQQWGFGTIAHGMTFVPIIIGYLIAYVTYLPTLIKQERKRKADPHSLAPESRLQWLCYTAPLLTIGLAGFAAGSLGPPVHWIVPMLFVLLVAVANYNIYMGTVDYMVAAYGPYSASATGGNALARDVLAGAAAMWAGPFYSNIPPARLRLVLPTVILMFLALIFTLAVYVIYCNGPKIRARSKMAQDIGHHREVVEERRHTLTEHDVADIQSAIRNGSVASGGPGVGGRTERSG